MADEYIRKQDAVDALDRIFDDVPMELTTEILRLRRELRGLPSADVVPVVHGEQTVDKCCETCKHKDRLASEWRCSECFRTSNLEDYWEPYTEDEA